MDHTDDHLEPEEAARLTGRQPTTTHDEAEPRYVLTEAAEMYLALLDAQEAA